MNQFEILRAKDKYKPGMKVRCIEYKDEYASIPEGTLGTVKHVDDFGTVHIAWENGSVLGVVIGMDEIEVVPQYRIAEIPEITKHVQLERKQDSIITETVSVSHVVILDDVFYEAFKDKLLDDYDFIEDINQKLADQGDGNDFIVVNESQTDGIVVASEGYNYARCSAHLSSIDEFQIPSCSLTQEREQAIRVLVVEPNSKPFTAIIENDLESLQAMVGGMIEEVQLSETAAIICHEEGKLLNLKANRRLGNDVLAGRFIVVGVDDSEHFKSLSPKDMRVYSNQFQDIEMIEQSEVQEKIGFEIQMFD